MRLVQRVSDEVEHGEDEQTEAKLEQLKSLLEDQGLRKALEDLRREEGGPAGR